MSTRVIPASAATRRLLELAREHLGMDVAWVSEFTDGQQAYVQVDEGPDGRGPAEGSSIPLGESYCVRVLDGRLPPVVPDSAADPRTAELRITDELGIGAYVGIPIPNRDGSVRGMLCCTSHHASPDLVGRDLRVLQLLAHVIGELTDDNGKSEAAAALTASVREVVRGTGRRHVLQPIVDVETGDAVGYEALARFDLEPFRPDLWFELADRVGLRAELELATASTALAELDAGRAGYLGVNLSPDVILDGALDDLLADRDPARVVVEITEHAQTTDYDGLLAALAPHRERGLRVAVDDAGAGYASFRHILRLTPDLIKADISLVRDIHHDPVRQALLSSVLTFARTSGARLVAEGVESQGELDTVTRLGVRSVQGYFLGRPTAAPPAGGFPRPSPDVLLDASDLSLLLAQTVRDAHDLESLTRPLLQVVLRLTGLETAYLTVLEPQGLAHRYVCNTGSIQLSEGALVPWPDSLCAAMQDKDLMFTGNAQVDLAECAIAGDVGLQSLVSVPVRGSDGGLLGTLCAGSRERVFVGESTLAHLRLIAHILSVRYPAPEAA